MVISMSLELPPIIIILLTVSSFVHSSDSHNLSIYTLTVHRMIVAVVCFRC